MNAPLKLLPPLVTLGIMVVSQGDTGNDDTDYTNNLEESQLGLDPTEDEKGLALTYTYDDLGRLTSVGGNSTAVSYTLDEEGNITLAD